MSMPKQDISIREDLGMLAVMEALADEEQVTQRELSRRTGLNLKKVNFCLHRLLEKGHVKFQRLMNNPDKRVYLYILTPSGLKEKSRLTYRFLQMTLGYYGRVEDKLRACVEEMGRAKVDEIVLCGATDAARIVLDLVRGTGIRVVGVLDEEHIGDEFEGVPIVSARGLDDLSWNGLLITALEDPEEVACRLRAVGLSDSMVWRLS